MNRKKVPTTRKRAKDPAGGYNLLGAIRFSYPFPKPLISSVLDKLDQKTVQACEDVDQDQSDRNKNQPFSKYN